jgi:RHS repeat-associated protein
MSYVLGLGSDEVLTRRWFSPSGPFDHYYHTNALGSVTALTDTTGAVVERYMTVMDGTFAPTEGNFSTVLNNILFTGRYYDPETKLYYYRARMYHPYFGRFLQRDPLGESASINLYNYVFKNPVNATDPTGLVCSVTHLSPDQEAAAAVMMSEMMAPGGGLDSSAMMDLHAQWLEGSAFGPDMHAKYQSSINANEEARRGQWLKDKQDKRLEKLKAELKASEKDPKYQENMENPKGVSVNFHGFGQNALKERSGETNKSELDENGKEGSEEGKVEYTITARNMMKPGKFGEVSEEALKIVADAVQGVTDKLCGNVPVEITGFSLGAGPAVGLTNTLTDHYGVSGSDITTNLIDPYMADGWNTINNSSVTVNLFTGTRSDPASIGLNWGAHLFGVGNRDVIRRGENPNPVNRTYLNVGHTHMDSWVPGAMGTQSFLGY